MPIFFPSQLPSRDRKGRKETPSTRQQVEAGAGGMGTDEGPQGLGTETAGGLCRTAGSPVCPILIGKSTSYSHFLFFYADSQQWRFPPPPTVLSKVIMPRTEGLKIHTYGALKEVTNHRETLQLKSPRAHRTAYRSKAAPSKTWAKSSGSERENPETKELGGKRGSVSIKCQSRRRNLLKDINKYHYSRRKTLSLPNHHNPLFNSPNK